MSFSPEYYLLHRRINELRKNLLPAVFDPTGSYPPEVFDHTRGFITLAHAEIEAFTEDRCLFVAQTSVKSWHASRTPTAITFTLYAMCYSDWAALDSPPTTKKGTAEVRIEARIDDALAQYEQIINTNHGIREPNLKKLLVPLSIRIKSDLDSAWISSMSSFGGKRGQVVHTSSRVGHPPDPKSTLDTVKLTILPGLRKLDTLLTLIEKTSIANPPLPRRTLVERLRNAWKCLKDN